MKRLLCAFLALLPTYALAQTTPNLQFQLPVFGSAGWSQKLNQNFTQLDQLLSGASTLTSLKLSGSITLGADPTTNTQAATKHYVDSVAASGNATQIVGIPVSATAPINGQILQFNGTSYVPMTVSTNNASSIQSVPVANTAPSSGQYFGFDGTNWGPVPAPSTTLPTAPAAGYAPVSPGPGNSYTAQAVAPGGGVWQREGTIISPNGLEEFNASEPTLLYEGNPQVLTGTAGSIFKLWWNCGYLTTGLCYAESVDGENWTRAAAPVIARTLPGPAHGYVFHYGSTYYYYGGNNAAGSTEFDRFESSDGVNWTLTHPAVLTEGAAGAWDSAGLGNVFIIPSSGTWLMMYEGYGGSITNSVLWMGTATSTDQGLTWTKYSGNPTIKGPTGGDTGGPDVHQVGSTYYVWYTCNVQNNNSFFPDDICRAHSTDFQTWTQDNSPNPVMTRATFDEGAGNYAAGQIADPSMVQVGGSIYMAYDGVYAQTGSVPDAFHLKLAVAPYTFAQLVQTSEGNATSMHANGSFNSLSLFPCAYWDANTSRVPCATSGVLNVGLFNFAGGASFPGLNYNTYYDGSANRYSSTGGAVTQYLDISGDIFHFAMVPAGASNSPASYSDVYQVTPSGVVYKTVPTVNMANPGQSYTDTNTGTTLSIGNSSGYGYLAAGAGPNFFGFSGWGSAPIIGQQANSVFGWTPSTNVFGTPDTALSRTAAGAVAVGNGTQGDASGTLLASNLTLGGVPILQAATQPTGSCSTVSWILSNDGHLTFCNGTTYVSKF